MCFEFFFSAQDHKGREFSASVFILCIHEAVSVGHLLSWDCLFMSHLDLWLLNRHAIWFGMNYCYNSLPVTLYYNHTNLHLKHLLFTPSEEHLELWSSGLTSQHGCVLWRTWEGQETQWSLIGRARCCFWWNSGASGVISVSESFKLINRLILFLNLVHREH